MSLGMDPTSLRWDDGGCGDDDAGQEYLLNADVPGTPSRDLEKPWLLLVGMTLGVIA